jgi:cytochrome c peroxidase
MIHKLLTAGLLLASANAVAAEIAPPQKAVIDSYLAAAGSGFSPSAERGRSFFYATHSGGKPDTASCTTCHSTDLKRPGQTKAGKAIEPMAASVTPTRYSDAAQVEKWFRRNCTDVLGRECTSGEKADVLSFLLSL